jgi:hypothetical protein
MPYKYLVSVYSQKDGTTNTFEAANIAQITKELKISKFTVERILHKSESCKMCNWISIEREHILPKHLGKVPAKSRDKQ